MPKFNLNFDFVQSALAQTIIGVLLLVGVAELTLQVPEFTWAREPLAIFIVGKFLSPAFIDFLERALAAYRTGFTQSERAQLSNEHRAELAFAVQQMRPITYELISNSEKASSRQTPESYG